MGAIASGGVRVLNEDVVAWYRIPESVIDSVARDEQAELERREREYRQGCAPHELTGRTVVLIDDGLATGSTMKAAVRAVRAHDPAQIIVAAPVGAPAACDEFAHIADASSARGLLSPSPRSACGTATSRRRPTTRCGRCFAALQWAVTPESHEPSRNPAAHQHVERCTLNLARFSAHPSATYSGSSGMAQGRHRIQLRCAACRHVRGARGDREQQHD
jgi:phosphoribosyl transferase-like protein